MSLLHGLLIITSIHLLAAASPGPDFVLVTQQTLSQGKRAGLLCSLGIALGLSIHILYSSLGLASLIANSVVGLLVIKTIGGLYLVYLGIKGLRAKPRVEQLGNVVPVEAEKSWLKTLGKGFFCNVFNPKAPIYFLSLFTVVLSPNMPLYQLTVYGVWLMFLQFFWFALVVTVLSRPLINRKFQRMGHWIDRIFGIAMVGLGLKVIGTRLN